MKKVLKGPWKKNYDYRFIAGEDLDGKEVTVTIDKVGIDEAFNGREKEDVVVVSFKEADKMMVLNKTNAKVIAKIAGSQNVEDWTGTKIILRPQMVNAFGQQTLAVRVKEDLSKYKV